MEQDSKQTKIMKEVKACLILILIIGVCSFLLWFWYTQEYLKNKDKNIEQMELVSYEAKENLFLVGDKYIVDKGDSLYAILSREGDTLWEEKQEITDTYMGIDSQLYAYLSEYGDVENRITLYSFKEKELEEVKVFFKKDCIFSPLLYQEEDSIYLLGFIGSNVNEEEEAYFVSLTGEEQKIDAIVVGDDYEDGVYYTFNSKGFVVRNKNNFFGVYDLEKEKLTIPDVYDTVQTLNDGNFLVKKKDKMGILDSNLKRVVDFTYDAIQKEDGFYIVGKDSKFALMDLEYNLITDFLFPYQEITTLQTYTYKNTYIIENTSTNKIYIINKDGSYSSTSNKVFVLNKKDALLYSKEGKKYTFYEKVDTGLESKYTIDFSSYDFTKDLRFSRILNTLVASGEKTLYFDATTGKELKQIADMNEKNKNYTYSIKENMFSIEIPSSKEVTFSLEEEDLSSIKIEQGEVFTYLSSTRFVVVKKAS